MSKRYYLLIKGDKRMWSLEDITNFIDNKIDENDIIIRITFYEMRIKYNLSEAETLAIIQLAATRLKNLNYNVYRKGEYVLDYQKYKVEENELLVAIKNKYSYKSRLYKK